MCKVQMMPKATWMRSHSATPLVVSSLLSPPGEGTCRILMINDHCLIKIPTEIPILKSPTNKKENLGTWTHKRKFNVFFQDYYDTAKYRGDIDQRAETQSLSEPGWLVKKDPEISLLMLFASFLIFPFLS